MQHQKLKYGSPNVSIGQELFRQLLDSVNRLLGIDSDSFEQRRYDEWKTSGPQWQKEVISEALILKDRIRNRLGVVRDVNGNPLDPPFLSEIRNKVWTHFQNLPSEETKDVGRNQVIDQFRKVVSSSMDIPEATKEVFLESLKQPLCSRENKFKRVVGLNPLQGEEKNGHR